MSTQGSAQIQTEQLDFPMEEFEGDPRAALKRQVAERLAAHRSRRGRQTGPTLIPIAEPKADRARTNPIAAAVAERYAQSQSYRDFLAAEAERAIDEANATAQVAARSAKAVAAAQQQLLAELEHWNDAPFDGPAVSGSGGAGCEGSDFADALPSRAPASPESLDNRATTTGLTVRLYEDVGVRQPELHAANIAYAQAASVAAPIDEEESSVLDDEIEFRQTPVFEEPSGPPIPIPANLIEFPRQLVAPRKARPRIAEGPLRDEADATPACAQLRIFEVEAAQIATAPDVDAEHALPVWSSIHLDAAPVAAPADHEEPTLVLPLQAAPLDLRLMSAAVDACILGATFLAAACGFAQLVEVLPAAPIAAVTAAAMLLVLFVLYHVLFFTFADATPGMRYARIGLCTFSDENPTRSQMRRRTLAILLAACPLGLGFLWAWLDDDRLGWHDRISRMYQRSY